MAQVGSLAVLKRSGIGHVLGITSRVTGNTQCSVLPLDLHNDSQRRFCGMFLRGRIFVSSSFASQPG